MITQFTKENVHKFREEFAEAVKSLEEKHGLTISLPRNINFYDDEFNPKISIKINNPKTTTLTQSIVPNLVINNPNDLVGKTFKYKFDTQRTLTVESVNGDNLTMISNRGKRFRVEKSRLLSDEFKFLY